MNDKEKGRELAAEACKWLNSNEGKKAIETVRNSSERTVNSLRDARRVDEETRYRPYNM